MKGHWKRLRVAQDPHGEVDLDGIDPSATHGYGKDGKEKAVAELEHIKERMEHFQKIFWGEAKRSVLVVLQAMDTAGKDGTIRAVMGHLNPQGVEVTGFKKPTPEEAAHDYLWRIHKVVPPKGKIGVFNRSHYEDILVPGVFGLLPKEEVKARYAQINDFERYLAANGATIRKFFLHISKDTQKERLEARLKDPHKQWKFSADDIRMRPLWPKFMKAYGKVLARTSTPWAPWYVIPAEKKWYRNVAVASILLETLEGLKPRYPKPLLDLSKVVVPD